MTDCLDQAKSKLVKVNLVFRLIVGRTDPISKKKVKKVVVTLHHFGEVSSGGTKTQNVERLNMKQKIGTKNWECGTENLQRIFNEYLVYLFDSDIVIVLS